VDAFEAAKQLHASSPEAFEVLCNTPVDFHYMNDGHHLHYTHPTFSLTPPYLRTQDQDEHTMPELSHINYSPPFQAPLPISTSSSFYAALGLFADRLREPTNRFEYMLKEGDAVIFDNRRVLHARTEFREWEDGETPSHVPKALEGETSRWLKGCYLEADGELPLHGKGTC
jgi:gamma-butyrobetaine dioxygenase